MAGRRPSRLRHQRRGRQSSPSRSGIALPEILNPASTASSDAADLSGRPIDPSDVAVLSNLQNQEGRRSTALSLRESSDPLFMETPSRPASPGVSVTSESEDLSPSNLRNQEVRRRSLEPSPKRRRLSRAIRQCVRAARFAALGLRGGRTHKQRGRQLNPRTPSEVAAPPVWAEEPVTGRLIHSFTELKDTCRHEKFTIWHGVDYKTAVDMKELIIQRNLIRNVENYSFLEKIVREGPGASSSAYAGKQTSH